MSNESDESKLTEEEIFEKNWKLIDVYYKVVSKSFTYMGYEDIVEDADGMNIVHGPDYIIEERCLLERRHPDEIEKKLKEAASE
tara:strand:+ start:462 stop:713 length:252 start_codon:yes stop_codon:yes gene_type:complete